MKFELPKANNSASKLGLDSELHAEGKQNDLSFYEWLAGSDLNKTIGQVMVWLFDEFREEKDQTAIRNILLDWRATSTDEEFRSRLAVVSRLMPEAHVFHKIKSEFIDADK